MRYRDLLEHAHPAKFKAWFAGSKVVDASGEPLRCYHGSTAEVQHPWRPLTHFGSSKAASQRAINPEQEGAARLYPVYLRIVNPIRVVDDWDQDDGDQLIWQALQKLVRRKLVDQEEYDLLQSKSRNIDEADHKLMAMQLVARCGFDGLVYRNRVEHRGSTSWVIFNGDQVWPMIATR